MVTADRMRLHLRKDNGLVKDVFLQHHMTELRGNMGLGHVRYPTAGSSSCAEAQPLYTNYPHGICVAHNGNLTNTDELYRQMMNTQRHINTDSDSELLLNSFAEFLTKNETELRSQRLVEKQQQSNGGDGDGDTEADVVVNGSGNGSRVDSTNRDDIIEAVFRTCRDVMLQCRGGYATVYLINGVGLVGFRDPHGIRPLVFGCRSDNPEDQGKIWTTEMMEKAGGDKRLDYCMASESVAIDTLGFQLVR